MCSTSPRAFKERMIQVYEAYGRRPLLISEFAVADWGAKAVAQNQHSPESVLEFMKDVLPWMEKQNWIAGSCWFSFGIDEAVGTSSALFDKEGDLTTLGRFYQSVTTEDPDGDQEIKQSQFSPNQRTDDTKTRHDRFRSGGHRCLDSLLCRSARGNCRKFEPMPITRQQ